jgi:hypothetical protein
MGIAILGYNVFSKHPQRENSRGLRRPAAAGLERKEVFVMKILVTSAEREQPGPSEACGSRA